MEDRSAIRTAGLILQYRDRYVFQLGPNATGTQLGFARIGGHLEPGEHPADCARREAFEEAGVAVELLDAERSYAYVPAARPIELAESTWTIGRPRPLLIARTPHSPSVSVTYLAMTLEVPSPRSESAALVQLTPDEVWWIATGTASVRDLIAGEGVLHTARPLPLDTTIEPRDQLLALAALLDMDPATVMRTSHLRDGTDAT